MTTPQLSDEQVEAGWIPYPEEEGAYGEKRLDVEAGWLLLLREDAGIRLVGDVNELLGICDDCRDFRHEDILAYLPDSDWERWVVVFRKEMLERAADHDA